MVKSKAISEYLSSVGKLGKGVPKTMTPAAKKARLAQMAKINGARKKRKAKQRQSVHLGNGWPGNVVTIKAHSPKHYIDEDKALVLASMIIKAKKRKAKK